MKSTLRRAFLFVLLQAAGAPLWSQSIDRIEPPPPGAPINPKPFEYSREIQAASAGLTAFHLDAAVLAHSRFDLGDLRIVDADNRQIPYLLDRRKDVLVVKLPPLIVENASPAAQSRYPLVLPFVNLPAARLILITPERTFERRVSLEVNRAGKGRLDSRTERVTASQWRHNDPDTPAPPLELQVPSRLDSTSATIIVDEGDNHRLALTEARLELPLYRVRFFYRGEGKLRLLYGNDSLSAPRYDLELLSPRLTGIHTDEAALGEERGTATRENGAIQARIFWAALVVAVAVVLALLLRLLRTETANTRK